MKELIQIGGPVLLFQLLLAFGAVVIALERLFFFRTTKFDVSAQLLGLKNALRRGSFAEALREAKRETGPAGRVAQAVISRHQLPAADLREIGEDALNLEVSEIEKNLRYLLAIATIAPLSGFLGTAIGLLQFFSALGDKAALAASGKFAEGLAASLITTVSGLTIALGAYLAYLLFLGKARLQLAKLQRTATEATHMLIDLKLETAKPQPSID